MCYSVHSFNFILLGNFSFRISSSSNSSSWKVAVSIGVGIVGFVLDMICDLFPVGFYFFVLDEFGIIEADGFFLFLVVEGEATLGLDVFLVGYRIAKLWLALIISASDSESESESKPSPLLYRDGISSRALSSCIIYCIVFLFVFVNDGILSLASLFLNLLRCVGIVSILHI